MSSAGDMDDLEEWNEWMSFSDTLKLLRNWRENNKRKGLDVIEIWDRVLSKNLKKLGNEKYVILEQVIFAALDTHQKQLATDCMNILHTEFPGSLRVYRYRAMEKGAQGDTTAAIEMLDKLIKHDETNAAARKQKVAIYKSAGMIQSAINELTEYLKKYMSDAEAWQELSDMYLNEGEYAKAVFCAEELLLHQPHSHLFHQRVAEIRYTMGNLDLAKSYYLQALKLNSNNMRALYGLYLTCNNLLSQYKGGATSSKKKEVAQQMQWALQQIKSKYEGLGPNVPFIEGPKSDEKDVDPIDSIIGPLTTLSVN